MKELLRTIDNHKYWVYGPNAAIIEWARDSKLAQSVYDKCNIDEDLLFKALDPRNLEEECDGKEAIKALWYAYPELGPYPFLETLSNFQFSKTFHEKYRDHVIHQLKVFLLGLYIFDQCIPIQKEILHEINADSEDTGKKEFVRRWVMCAIYHDIGYVLENERGNNPTGEAWKKTQEIMNDVLATPLSTLPLLKEHLPKEFEERIINDEGLSCSKILSLRDIEQYRNKRFLDLNSLVDYGIKSGLGSGKESPLGAYYQYAFSHEPIGQARPRFRDHGIVSALLLLRIWCAYREYVQKFLSTDHRLVSEDVIQTLKSIESELAICEKSIESAAGSIALHNITPSLWDRADALGYDLTLNAFRIRLTNANVSPPKGNTPMAFLLGLADTLQDWDRRLYSSQKEGDSPGINDQDIELYVTQDHIYLSYVADKKRFKDPENDAASLYWKMKERLKAYLEEKAIDELLRCGELPDDALWCLECGIRGRSPGTGKPSKTKQISDKEEKRQQDTLSHPIMPTTLSPGRVKNQIQANLSDVEMKKTVFISYSQKDMDFVVKLKEALEAKNIGVTIDIEAAKFGDNLDEFVEKSVREADFTVSVVSKSSLQSVWVIAEALETLMHEKVGGQKKFVPIYKDKSFLDDEFYLEIVDGIDASINKLGDLTIRALDRNLGTANYDDKRRRLVSLRNNLDKILARFRKYLVGDFSTDERFQQNLPKLVESIKEEVAAPVEEKIGKEGQKKLDKEKENEIQIKGEYNKPWNFINCSSKRFQHRKYYFQNRGKELDKIRKFLRTDEKHLLTINGRSGIGKRSLLCHTCYELRNESFLDKQGRFHVICFSLESNNEKEIDEVIYRFFYQLDKFLLKECGKELEQLRECWKKLEEDPRLAKYLFVDKLEAYLDKFHEHYSNDWILILIQDPFELLHKGILATQDSLLLKTIYHICGNPGYRVKFIINPPFEVPELKCRFQEQQITEAVPKLDRKYARDLLLLLDEKAKGKLTAFKKSTSEELFEKDIESAWLHTGGVPRTLIRLFIEYNGSSDHKKLDDTVKQLKLQDRGVAPMFKGFNENKKAIMKSLAIYNRPVSLKAIEHMLQQFSVDKSTVITELQELCESTFVQQSDDKYYLSPMDHHSVITEIRKEDKQSLYEWGADYFKQVREKEKKASYEAFQDLYPLLIEFDLRLLSGNYYVAEDLLDDPKLESLPDRWLYWQQIIQLRKCLRDIDANEEFALRNLEELGYAYQEIGNFEEELKCYEAILKISANKQLPDMEKGCLSRNFGLAYYNLGKYEKAIHYFEDAKKIFKKEESRWGIGLRLSYKSFC